ncbi:MAG: ATPase, T2SS/T4P/T4SS family [Pseudomonadales bacterium]|nr:ATPase, T2SS/T4P/T4SS family [Pseudomonadales bacterium]
MSVLIHIQDLQDTRVGEFKLEHSLSLGKSADCDIVLDSPYISATHARFEADGPQVYVQSLGLNGVMVNDVDVSRGTRMELKPEDVVSMPGFILHITGLRPTRQASDYEMERALSDLKRDIHSELLESANLTGVVMETNTADMSAEIDEKLSTMLERISLIDEALLEHIVLKAVREAAVSTVVRGQMSESKRRSLAWEASADRIAFDQLVAMCLSELGIAESYGSLAIAQVRDRFADVYQHNAQALSQLQKRYIARESIRADILALVYGLGPLEDLMQLPDITEIMVVGKDKIFIEKGGGLEETGRAFPSEDDLNVAVNRMVRPIGRALNRAEPIVDARLEDGSRVHIVIPPVAIKGTSVTIRRFREDPFTLDDLISFGSLTPQAARFLRACILSRKNMVISGGTGSGKTTLLNVLGAEIPDDQRLVVIEDSAELQLPQPNQVNLETRKANLEGKGEIPIKSLVRASLRMRPDRIVVGECRSGEALDMLQAMNTGHDGSLTTGHANSPREMIQRLQVMVMEAGEDMPVTAIRQQIAAAVDVIVQIQRQRDRSRKITHISEIVGYDASEGEVVMEDIFTLVPLPDGGSELRFTGYLPSFADYLLVAGDTSVEELFAWH